MRGFLGDSYELLDRISAGGMAEIFRARRRGVAGFERIFAVKRILPSIARDPSFVTMFMDEARIAAKLSHPNIIQTLDFGVSDGEYFLAMELVDGVDLGTVFAECRARDEPMPVRYACRIVAEVCDALSYAYNKRDERGQPMRVVHRDVSPSNVLISHCGTVKLIDFGLARASERKTRTRHGVLKGKFRYLSPERVRGRVADHRSDVFSAGILLWELLTRRRLFEGSTDWEVLESIRACEVAPASDRNDQVRPELDEILERALALEPNDRYQDAGELADQLRDYARRWGEHCSGRDLARWVAELEPNPRLARASVPPPVPRQAPPPPPLPPPPPRPPARRRRRAVPPPIPTASFEDVPTIAFVRKRRASTNRFVVPRRGSTEPPAARAVPERKRRSSTNRYVVPRRAPTEPPAAVVRASVRITSQPAGASVLVTADSGKTTIGTTPMYISVDCGARYRLVMRKPGHAPIYDTLCVASAAGPVDEAYTLCPLAPPEIPFAEDSSDISDEYAEYSVQ